MAPEHVDVMADEWREADEVFVTHIEAVAAELGDGGVHVAGVEEHQGIEDESEGADLVFHAVLVALVELPVLAVEDLPRQCVAAFLEVGLHLGLPPVGRLVRQTQDVQGLGDPPVVRDRVAQRGGSTVAGQHPDHVVGPHRAGVDGADDPQDGRHRRARRRGRAE